MNNKLIPIVLTLVVGIILAGSVLVPVLNDATETEKTFDNTADALWQVEKLDTDSEYTFEWDHTDPTKATVNGETVNLQNGTVICATDTFLLRYGKDGTGYYLQSVPGSTLNAIVYSAGSDAGDLTITATSGTITATSVKGSTTTSSTSFTEGYGIVAKGNYVMKAPTQEAYMLDDSPIVAMGLTTLGGVWYNIFQITGNVEGVTVEQINPNPATYTVSDVEINKTAVNGYIGLSKLSSITFVATQIEDTTVTQDCTYNYFIVPASVTAELSQHLTPGQIALMGAIPVLVIVALLVVAVGVVARRNE